MPNLKKKILNYPQQNILDAIEEVKRGNSVKATAKKYGVPRITLMYKIKGKLPVGKRMGPKSIFTTEQENILVEWVISMAKAGFPVTKNIFMASVAKLAKELALEKIPGEKWYKLFRARNTKISDRIYQTLTRSQASVTTQNLEKWFEEIWSYVEEKELVNVMKDHSRVFNADETAFYMNPKGGKVLAEKGSKSVYLAGANDEKENITVLLTANAVGQIAPPMIVYRYKRIPLQIAETVPQEWAIGRSENGWMTQELFFEYIANIFLPWLKKENIEIPIVFFLDGHSSHISLHLSDFCAKNGIQLMALYPNATHIMQPMDVSVFHSLKSDWRKRVHEWRMDHTGEELKKKDFPPLLQDVILKIEPTIIQNGFKKCGLMPWNPQAIKLPLNMQPPRGEKDIRKIKEFLLYLEEEIGEKKLLQFKNNEGEWSEPEDLSLYNIWKKNKNKLASDEPIFPAAPSQELPAVSSQDLSAASQVLPVIAAPPQELLEFPPQDLSAAQPQEMSAVASQNLEQEQLKNQGIEEPLAVPGPSGLQPQATPVKDTVIDPNIPSPFKRILFWPERKPQMSKRMKREKIPAVLTSPQTINYYKKKAEEKQQKAEKQANKKKVRKEKENALLERKKAAEEVKKTKNREKINKINKKKQEDSDSTTSLSSPSLEDTDSSEWDEDFEDVNCDNDDLPFQAVSSDHLMGGDFLLCEFLGGKRNQTKFIYLCVLQEKGKDEIQVMGLKSIDKAKKEFVPKENDISSISIQQVIGRVAQPQVLSRGERISYIFKKSLPVKEV